MDAMSKEVLTRYAADVCCPSDAAKGYTRVLPWPTGLEAIGHAVGALGVQPAARASSVGGPGDHYVVDLERGGSKANSVPIGRVSGVTIRYLLLPLVPYMTTIGPDSGMTSDQHLRVPRLDQGIYPNRVPVS